MFISVNTRRYLVPFMGLMLLSGIVETALSGIVETAGAADSCDIEDVCEAVDTHKADNKSLDDSMNSIVAQCEQPLSGSSCPLDQIVNHCWHKNKAKLEKCEIKNKE